MYKTIAAEKSGAMMTVTLNNPPVNIMTMQTEDAVDGLNAFLEKRKPVWRDK